MQSTDLVEFNSLSKIINTLYDVRDFLFSSLTQTRLFEKWLESADSLNYQEIIIKFHNQLSQLMLNTGIKKQAYKKTTPHKESSSLTTGDEEEEIAGKEKLLFIQALFGEKLDVNYYFPGLLQNKFSAIFHYLRAQNNQDIKKYLLGNLALLEESAVAWTFYKENHISIDILITQSKLELTKMALSTEVANLKKNQFEINPVIIKKPIINAVRPIINKTTHPTPPPDLLRTTREERKKSVQIDSGITAHQPIDAPPRPQILSKKATFSSSNIVLTHLDKLPTIHALFNAVDRQGANRLLNYMGAALNLYETLKQLINTYYFPETLTLDEYILDALIYSPLYTENTSQLSQIIFDENKYTKTNMITRYCESVIKFIPQGLIIGEPWTAGEYSLQDRMRIEKYWYDYYNLLQAHIKSYPNKQLQKLMKTLSPGNASDEEKISERTASLSASLGNFEPKMLPIKWIRSKSFTSLDLLSKLRNGPVVSRPLKRLSTAPAGNEDNQFIQQFRSKKL
jgi:hypothetical protein